MSSPTTTAVEAYASRVRLALSDLPAADRDALIADLEDHLTEVADEGALADLLGTPEAYAAELRSSAGLPPRRPAEGRTPPPWLTGTRDYLGELRPAWWLARGAFVGGLLGLLLGSVPGMVLLAVAGAVGSVLLGLRTRERPGLRAVDATASALATVALIVLLLGLMLAGGSGPEPADRLGEVGNLYPYSSDGSPLRGVQLFDQYGNPVDLGYGNVYPHDPDNAVAVIPPTAVPPR